MQNIREIEVDDCLSREIVEAQNENEFKRRIPNFLVRREIRQCLTLGGISLYDYLYPDLFRMDAA